MGWRIFFRTAFIVFWLMAIVTAYNNDVAETVLNCFVAWYMNNQAEAQEEKLRRPDKAATDK